jgi:uncharacterized secreted protein with C-terminal beta-propeller domain
MLYRSKVLNFAHRLYLDVPNSDLFLPEQRNGVIFTLETEFVLVDRRTGCLIRMNFSLRMLYVFGGGG